LRQCGVQNQQHFRYQIQIALFKTGSQAEHRGDSPQDVENHLHNAEGAKALQSQHGLLRAGVEQEESDHLD
jgi:hypothetical protein